MKKIAARFCVWKLGLVLSLTVLFSQCNFNSLANFPVFEVLLLDSVTVFNTADVPEGRPIILINYVADCDNCNKEVASILDNMEKFQDVRFYLTTNQTFDHVSKFAEKYQLQKYPNVTIGQDLHASVAHHFQSTSIPLMAVYDKDKKLKKIFKGDPGIDTLLRVIHDI